MFKTPKLTLFCVKISGTTKRNVGRDIGPSSPNITGHMGGLRVDRALDERHQGQGLGDADADSTDGALPGAGSVTLVGGEYWWSRGEP